MVQLNIEISKDLRTKFHSQKGELSNETFLEILLSENESVVALKNEVKSLETKNEIAQADLAKFISNNFSLFEFVFHLTKFRYQRYFGKPPHPIAIGSRLASEATIRERRKKTALILKEGLGVIHGADDRIWGLADYFSHNPNVFPIDFRI